MEYFTLARRFAEERTVMTLFAKTIERSGYSMWHPCLTNDAVVRIRS